MNSSTIISWYWWHCENFHRTETLYLLKLYTTTAAVGMVAWRALSGCCTMIIYDVNRLIDSMRVRIQSLQVIVFEISQQGMVTLMVTIKKKNLV